MNTGLTIPKIISVDDHVVEPPDLWTSTAPASIRDRVPRVEHGFAEFGWSAGKHLTKRTESGLACDWWVYEDYEWAFAQTLASVGLDEVDNVPTTYAALRAGAWKQADRLQDMDDDHVQASLCFPNTLPRFCGQTFAERTDKELALWCLQTYNNWVLDEWCAGPAKGRLLPVVIVPLWDVDLAVAEIHRCAAKGSLAVSFSENPTMLGLPSVNRGYWDPLFRACEETETTVCMHIGSSSNVFSTSVDSPFIVSPACSS